MRRRFISFITVLAFTICVTPASLAQDLRFANDDPFANRNAAHVGLYLKIPFSGGLKNYKKDKIKFGATLGVRRNYQNNYSTNLNSLRPRRHITVNVLDLKFNENGYKTISLVGQDLTGLKNGDIIFLEDEKGGVTVGKVALYALAGLGALIVVGVVVMAVDKCSRPLAGFGTDECN